MLPVDTQLVAQLYKPTQWEVTQDPAQQARRSIYLIAKRNLRLPFMEVFDQPTLQSSCACREESTHAPQALELLNGRLSNELAEHLLPDWRGSRRTIASSKSTLHSDLPQRVLQPRKSDN